MRGFIILILMIIAGAVRPAAAADLASGLSTDLIEVTSSFTGTDIVVFGAIEETEAELNQDRDVVVVIRGPAADMMVRRKQRVAGIWVNTGQVLLSGMPGYYFLASTRTLDDIASLSTLERFQLGTAQLQAAIPPDSDAEEADAFRAAAIRERKRERLYWESPTGIEFISRALFRARIPVPATVPPGQYRAETYLFQNGTVVSAQSSPLFIDKTGLERQAYNLAHRSPFVYGIGTVALALLLGWIGFAVFRERAT